MSPPPGPRPSWAKAIGFGVLAGCIVGFVAGSEGVPWPAALAAGAVAAVVFTFVAYAAEKARLRRAAEFAALALQHGWTHRADVRDGVARDLAACKPYSAGRDVRAEQLLSGQRDGVQFHVVAGQYTTGGGRSRQTHAVSSVAIRMPFELLLTIEPETFGHKVRDTLGGEDIDVESDEFSRRFWVQSPDRRKAFDVLHPRAVEFLLGLQGAWHWHWNGPYLLMSTARRLEAKDCLPLLQQAWAFRALLPRHLAPAPPPVAPPWRRSG